MNPINLAIKDILDKRQISMIELSKTTGVSYPTLKRFLGSNHDISSKKLMLILEELNIDFSELISKETENTKVKLPPYMSIALKKLMKGVGLGT